MDSNEVSEKYVHDSESCEQTIDLSANTFGVNTVISLKEFISIENEAKRLCFESDTFAYDLDLEKDLRLANKKYYKELCEFMNKIEVLVQNVKQKSDIKKAIYGLIDKIINGLKSQVEVCQEIVPLAQSIDATLVNCNANQLKHYMDCVIMIAEAVNRAVAVNNYEGIISKIQISNSSSANDIARDCLQTIKLLKICDSMDPISKKIADNLRIEKRLDQLEKEIDAKISESKLEEERLIVEINNLEQLILENEKMKKEESLYEEHQKLKLQKLLKENQEKTQRLINIMDKIDYMSTKLNEWPLIEKEFYEVKEKLEKSENKLALLDEDIKQTRLASKVKQNFVDDLRKVKTRFETMAKEYKAINDSDRQKKAEHTEKLEEKRKIKEQLEKEILMLQTTMNQQ